MFGGKEDTTPKYEVETLIGKSSVFNGNMEAEGTVRVEVLLRENLM